MKHCASLAQSNVECAIYAFFLNPVILTHPILLLKLLCERNFAFKRNHASALPDLLACITTVWGRSLFIMGVC